ncbi:MAG: hypothetical protein U5L09_12375 [Bacteroidales bacterium]|nr:hypothetical protein [Bacteroidales bacterium]
MLDTADEESRRQPSGQTHGEPAGRADARWLQDIRANKTLPDRIAQ